MLRNMIEGRYFFFYSMYDCWSHGEEYFKIVSKENDKQDLPIICLRRHQRASVPFLLASDNLTLTIRNVHVFTKAVSIDVGNPDWIS